MENYKDGDHNVFYPHKDRDRITRFCGAKVLLDWVAYDSIFYYFSYDFIQSDRRDQSR